MKSRFHVGVALVALTAQLLVPLAAYASAAPAAGFDDFCSAIRAAPVPGSSPALPRPYSPRHGPSHCAYCFGSASAALLPGVVSLAAPPALWQVALPHGTRVSVAAATVRLPPSRGPPELS